MDQQKPETLKKNGDDEDVQGNLSHDLPEWLEEFRQNLVDESVPEHRDSSSSSHGLPSVPRGSGIGQAPHFYSLPEGPKLRCLLENQNNKGFVQKTHSRSSTSYRKVW